jgi:hypothetical protein
MTYHRGCNEINPTGTTSGAGTAYPSGAPESTPVLVGLVLLDLYQCLIEWRLETEGIKMEQNNCIQHSTLLLWGTRIPTLRLFREIQWKMYSCLNLYKCTTVRPRIQEYNRRVGILVPHNNKVLCWIQLFCSILIPSVSNLHSIKHWHTFE